MGGDTGSPLGAMAKFIVIVQGPRPVEVSRSRHAELPDLIAAAVGHGPRAGDVRPGRLEERRGPVVPLPTRPEGHRMSRDAVAATLQDRRRFIHAGPRARAARMDEDSQRRPTTVEPTGTTAGH